MKDSGFDVTAEDFWRLDRATRLPFREWQHFIVLVDGLELLVNFNHSHEPAEAGAPVRPTSRVIVIARTDRWHGFVETAAADRAWIGRDGRRCRFGSHALDIGAGAYRVEVEAPEHGISLLLRFQPSSLPMIAPAQGVGGGRRLSWIMVPRARVDGVATIGERRFTLDQAPGYHDHNWGHFRWGDDFAWEWGIALPLEPRLTDALVLSSLQNRARTEITLEQLFMWRDGRNLLSASGSELQVAMHGPAREPERWVLPAVMSLLRGRFDSDLPSRLDLEVRGDRARISARFCPESVAELVVPSDVEPLGLVTIHECIGPFSLEGEVAGHGSIQWEGRGVFEFLRA